MQATFQSEILKDKTIWELCGTDKIIFERKLT
jgi:hypothetical protein